MTKTESGPSRAKAIAEAGALTNVYRQGDGWIVSIWDEDARAWRLSHEMPYHQAQEMACRSRTTDALVLLGMDPEAAIYAAEDASGRFEARVRAILDKGGDDA